MVGDDFLKQPGPVLWQTILYRAHFCVGDGDCPEGGPLNGAQSSLTEAHFFI